MRLWHRRPQRLGTDRAADWDGVSDAKRSRPRVLVEVRDPAEAMSYWRLLGDNGYEVSWCPGPSAASSCVLVEEGHCPLVERADTVITALDPDDPLVRPVLEELPRCETAKRAIAVPPAAGAKRWASLFASYKVLEPVMVTKDLLPILETARFGPDAGKVPVRGPASDGTSEAAASR